MRGFWASKFRKSTSGPIGVLTPVMIVGTALLSLRSEFRTNLIPYAPYFTLAMQVGLGLFGLVHLRIRTVRGLGRQAFLFFVFAAFAFWSASTAFWSEYSYLVLQRTLLVFVPVVFLFLMVWSDSTPILTFQRVSLSMVILLVVLVILGIILYFFGTETSEQGFRVQRIRVGPITLAQNVVGYPFARMSSLLGNPNTLASWILMVLPLAFYILNARVLERWVAWGLILVLMSGLLLTFSRTGLGSTLVATGIYIYFATPGLKQRLGKLFLFGALVAVLLGLFVKYSDVGGVRFTLDLNSRDEIWAVLTDSLPESALLGVGFGVSSEAILRTNEISSSAHNAHLMILVESGIIGYTLFLLIWGFSLFWLILTLKHLRGKNRYLLSALVAIQFSILVHQVFEGSLMRYGFPTLFWSYFLSFAVHPLVTSTASSKSLSDTQAAETLL